MPGLRPTVKEESTSIAKALRGTAFGRQHRMILAVAFAMLALNGQPDSGDIEPVPADALCAEDLQTPTLQVAAALEEPSGALPGVGGGGDDSERPPTPPHTGIHALFAGLWLDIKNLPSPPNAYIAAIGGGAAAAVHPWDRTFNVRLRSHYDVVDDVFAPASTTATRRSSSRSQSAHTRTDGSSTSPRSRIWAWICFAHRSSRS